MLSTTPLFSTLTEFKEFILVSYEQKMKAVGKIPKDAVLNASDVDLFLESGIVEECLQELGIDDIDEYFENVDDLKEMQTNGGQSGVLGQGAVLPEESLENTGGAGSLISEYLNELLAQDEIKELADKNGDGVLSQDEILAFMDSMSHYDGDTSNLSLQDLISSANFFQKLSNDNTLEALALSNSDVANVTNPFTGGSTIVPQAAEVSKYDSNNNPILENWSVDELNQELKKQEGSLKSTTDSMNGAISGNDSKSEELKNQEDLAHQKLEEYKQNHNNELSQKLAEFDKKTAAVKEAENNVFENEQNIINATNALAQKETALTNATASKTGLESSLATLEGQLTQAQGQSQSQDAGGQSAAPEIQSKITQVKSEISKAQGAIKAAEKARDEAKVQKEAFEAKREGLNAALATAKEALSVTEEEMKAFEGYGEIEEFLNSYNQARKQTTEYKAAAVESAKTAVGQQRESISKLEAEINKRELEQTQTKVKYNPTAMNNTVNYFGEDYTSLLSQDEIYALQKQIGATGMSNTGNMPSKCLQCGTNYMQWIEGRNGCYSSNFSFQKENILKGIKDTLDSGRATNIMVTTKAGSRHFVTVIGYKENAGETLKESDLLVIDTYDGQIDGMGGSGGVAGNYRTLYAQDKGYRYDILSNKYTWKMV